jgi:hypothetical protein
MSHIVDVIGMIACRLHSSRNSGVTSMLVVDAGLESLLLNFEGY